MEYLVWRQSDLRRVKRMTPSPRTASALSRSCDFSFPLILRSLWVSSNKQRVGVNYLNRKAWKHSKDAVLGTPRKRLEIFQVALIWPFDWQMAVCARSLGRADVWPRWRVYPVIITMSSVKQRHGKAPDPERQAINQYSSHTTCIYSVLTHLALEKK